MGPGGRSRCTIPKDLAAFVDEMRSAIMPPVELHEIKDAHQQRGVQRHRALEIFDRWVEAGIVPPGRASAAA